MSKLFEYIHKHVERGECKCGQCIDVGDKPDPSGHTADLVFFKVALKDEPAAEVLQQLSNDHHGAHCQVNPFDGNEHGYMELGGWLDDQGTALMFMGMTHLLGLTELLTPKMLPGLPDALIQQMAGSGMVTIKSKADAA